MKQTINNGNSKIIVHMYLAGSMFCEADRIYNAKITKDIVEGLAEKGYIRNEDYTLYVPQENLSINDKTKCADSRAIFNGDYERLKDTDILIARIDGDIPPSGTSAEIGMMAQRYKTEENSRIYQNGIMTPKIIGLCTDVRNPRTTYSNEKNILMHSEDYENQYCYFNLFTIGCIKTAGVLATNIDQIIQEIEKYLIAIKEGN